MGKLIAVVDDDLLNLKTAERILSFNGYDVDCLASGEELLEYVEDKKPDLILLDIYMTGIDGFETLKRLQKMKKGRHIPVIFLTSDGDSDTETKALSSGAMDFIVKPFVDTILLLRVQHTLELARLQNDLKSEVKRMSGEIIKEHDRNEKLSLQVVKTLAGAIDAKDKYTKGHSTRVAEYAREIAKRAGKSDKYQEELYMMGLLHDVGKIGVPDTVMNKPSKLTDEEYAVIKTHPTIGHEILKNIKEMPKLAVGAKWHHERFDGTGYPDGLVGENIPEEARILSVADAYDAMSSRRSYHDIYAQEYIKNELLQNMGTQFDPKYAMIMLTIIEEDTDYVMREHTPDEKGGFSGEDGEQDNKGERLFSFLSMLEAGGLDTAIGIRYCMNDPKFYREMLSEFAVSARDREAMMNAYFTLKDWDKYRVYVHSLKSASMTIGAKALSEYARKVEDACKNGDLDYVLDNHESLIARMNGVVGGILMTIAVYGEQ